MQKITETEAKQGRSGIRIAVIVITSVFILGLVGWLAMFTAS